MKDRLNFIKWQLASRLPSGSIGGRVLGSIKYSDLSSDDPFYYIYWLDLNIPLWRKYLLGTYGTESADYEEFIYWLEQYRDGEFYHINTRRGIITIPVPRYEDYKCFKAEFLDIIMTHIHSSAYKEPFLEGPYEHDPVTLKPQDVVLDLGANYGLFSSLAASLGCEVYAFEPTTSVFENYLYPLSLKVPNIEVVDKAVSRFTGYQEFQLFQGKPSCNRLIESTTPQENTITVPTTSIDDFVKGYNLSTVDFIKADIEGAERDMLEGAKETLREFSPKLALCYYHRLDDLKALRKLILEANPNYKIEKAYRKIYAYNPKKTQGKKL